jgi:hypothetical protein
MESNSVPQQSPNLNRPEVLCLPATTGLAKIFTKNISAIVLTGTTYDVHLSSGTIFTVELNLPSDLKNLEDELASFYDNMDGKTDNFHEIVDTGELEIVGVNKHDDDCSDGCVCGLDSLQNQYDDYDFDVHDDVTERYVISEDEEPASDAEFFEEDTEDVVEDTAEEVVESEPSQSDDDFMSPEVLAHLMGGGSIELQDGKFVIGEDEE